MKLGPLTVNQVNERPVALLLLKGEPSATAALQAQFIDLATKYFNQWNAEGKSGDDHPLSFLYNVNPEADLVKRLRTVLKLPDSESSQLIILHLPAQVWMGLKASTVNADTIKQAVDAFVKEEEDTVLQVNHLG
jgi:hypothetical protein